jgi:hypothetical protein
MANTTRAYLSTDLRNYVEWFSHENKISMSISIATMIFCHMKKNENFTDEQKKKIGKYLAYVTANAKLYKLLSGYSQFHKDKMAMGKILAEWRKSKKEQLRLAADSIVFMIEKYTNFDDELILKDHLEEIEQMRECLKNKVFLRRFVDQVIEEYIVFSKIEKELHGNNRRNR